MSLTMTPVPVRVRCPMTDCRFEHTPARPRPETAHAVELPGGVVLAAPDPATGGFGVDRAGSHLVYGHSLAEWIAEVVRLRSILADPDSQVAAARELQQLALERARQAEAERDAALAEIEQLRSRLGRAEISGKPEPQRSTSSAQCEVCGHEYRVRLDGCIRTHNRPGTRKICSGSGAGAVWLGLSTIARFKSPEPQRTTPSAECPVCGRPFLVRIDGRIRLHNQPGKTQQSCSGSGSVVGATGTSAVVLSA